MLPNAYASAIHQSVLAFDGPSLSALFSLREHVGQTHIPNLAMRWKEQMLPVIGKKGPWAEMAIAHTEVLLCSNYIQDSLRLPDYEQNPIVAYDVQAKLVSAFLRWFTATNNDRWALPVLWTICNDLRELAIEADKALVSTGAKPIKLEEAASRHLLKAFSACASDRGGALDTSRRWGTYSIASLLFKTYFKLKALALCKNIRRAIESANDLPPLSAFPRGDQVAYRYHMGVFAFLNEQFTQAEEDLTFALSLCPPAGKFTKNRELILTYLIPIRLMRGILPSSTLLQPHAQLSLIYTPFVEAIRSGNLRRFDETLVWAEQRLLVKGTYLAVESAREVCLRRLLKKIWLTQQTPTPQTRLSISTFQQGLNYMGIDSDSEEVECILANMIFKGYVKGYLSHTMQKVVLSAKNPFPQLPVSVPQ